ncbi:MAG: hypothetical protein WCT18_04240 [Patescibacteria group bacterium]
MSNNIYNNLDEKELKVGYWWVTHRVQLRQLFYIFFGIIAIFFLFFGFGGLVKFYIIDRGEHLALENDLVKPKLNYVALSEVNTPKNLQIANSWVIKAKEGHYDFVAEVSNPNKKWYAKSFVYYFVFGDQKTESKTGYILPESTRYLLDLNFLSDAGIKEANLIIENISWQKVDDDFAVVKNKMLQLRVEDIAFVSAQSNSATEKENITNVSFAVNNLSNYNYWQPSFVVLLLRRGEMFAVSSLLSPKLDSKERRVESLNIFQYLPRDVEVKIVPEINILDPAVFKSFDLQQNLR